MQDTILRRQLVELLEGGQAHLEPEQALAGVPFEAWATRARHAPYTLWQLLEHARICQWDILEFSRRREHVSPDHPEGYWPATDGPPDDAAVAASIEAFNRDLQEMIALVEDPAVDLFARIEWGDGQTILREAMLVADHNAYHLGQFVLVRKLLGVWPT
ncbi:MAG: DinB family protein [Luteitalea sp.]|nr:DinB family protein [Luteitalea sp.]